MLFCFQHLMSGWLLDYSYTCQPVDYSHNQKALRVSIFHLIEFNVLEIGKFAINPGNYILKSKHLIIKQNLTI